MGVINIKFNHHYFNFVLLAVFVGFLGFSEPFMYLRNMLEGLIGSVLTEFMLIVAYLIFVSLYILLTKMIKKQNKSTYLLKFAGVTVVAFLISSITAIGWGLLRFIRAMQNFN